MIIKTTPDMKTSSKTKNPTKVVIVPRPSVNESDETPDQAHIDTPESDKSGEEEDKKATT